MNLCLLFKNTNAKKIYFVLAFMLLLFVQARSQQQVITFPDGNLRNAILDH